MLFSIAALYDMNLLSLTLYWADGRNVNPFPSL